MSNEEHTDSPRTSDAPGTVAKDGLNEPGPKGERPPGKPSTPLKKGIG